MALSPEQVFSFEDCLTLTQHRDIDAIGAANPSKRQATVLRLGTANTVKRISIRKIRRENWYDAGVCESPWTIEPFVELKTIWHPSAL